MNRKSVLKEALKKIKPEKEELILIDERLKVFLKEIKERIEKKRIDAEIFIGGSFAKKTLIRKDNYDVDIFLRFGKKEKNISELTEEIIKDMNFKRIHGSRDYFRIKIKDSLIFELVPVRKIKNPKEAENITDLSYSHVKYINRKIKDEKIFDEILLAKAFCYSKNCYGAESYIRGFSGYSIELLVYYYKSFLKFIRAITRIKEKEIIDIEKKYKNRQEVLMNMNSSKLNSPIILIDPTYKQRNALAALSSDTLTEFKKKCTEFLKNPSLEEFEKRKENLEELKKEAKRKNYEFIVLKVKTDRQKGDIAGSKLLKFYKHLSTGILRFFEIKKKCFFYSQKKDADYFFAVKKRGEVVYNGPFTKDRENLRMFKKKHKYTFVKKGRVFSKKKINFKIEEFIKKWEEENKKIIKEMGIKEIKIKE